MEPKTKDQKEATDKLNDKQRSANVQASANKEALESEKLTPEEKEAEKKAKFKQLASARASNVVKQLSLISNCGNKAAYSYTDEQVEKMWKAIEDQLARTKEAFKVAAKKETTRVEL